MVPAILPACMSSKPGARGDQQFLEKGHFLYKWYTSGANLGISGKFDPLFVSLALAYF